MVNFPHLILKVNFCLFSSFPYPHYPASPTDGSPKHNFRLVSMKGSFKDSCHLPHRLGDEMLLCCSLGSTGGKLFGLLCPSPQRTSLSHMLDSSKWKSSLFTTIISRFHTRCSDRSHSTFFQVMKQGAVCQRENIMSFSALTAKSNFKGSLFLISCFGFHLDMLKSP